MDPGVIDPGTYCERDPGLHNDNGNYVNTVSVRNKISLFSNKALTFLW